MLTLGLKSCNKSIKKVDFCPGFADFKQPVLNSILWI